ncbi:uncharacterized protein [Mytilus edulis]|uniref:uncharacterized protein n=1 Tax=Mytilus edulis TaxID=6550 RepID=UPI0039EFFAFF
MRKTIEDAPRGIRWNISSILEDLDFADDLALLSNIHHHLQEKTNRHNTFTSQVGIKISQTKKEVIIVYRKDLPITETFIYLGSTIRNDGAEGNDIMNRLNKARNIFRSLNNVWK